MLIVGEIVGEMCSCESFVTMFPLCSDVMGIQGPCSLPWAHHKIGPIVDYLNITSDYIVLRHICISINLKHHKLW
jgi:hypothetical protein